MSRLQLLDKETDLYKNNCEGCAIVTAIETAEHGRACQKAYCVMLCPVGRQLQGIGQELEKETLKSKALEFNAINMRMLLKRGFMSEELAEIFNKSVATIQRRKREWKLTSDIIGGEENEPRE